MTEASRDEATAIDPAEYRRVLGHLPTGVTVVTAAGSEGPVGVTIGSFVSISLDPPLVGFFLGKDSTSWSAMEHSGHFCVNVLTAAQQELCLRMASTGEGRFEGVAHTPAPWSGAPMLAEVHAVIDCSTGEVVPAGDHILIMGRVRHLRTADHETDPMVFHRGQFGSFSV
jgi:flavin reductase (DIM6/NTAB) family NADH-FMN oxidoreductase RutF